MSRRTPGHKIYPYLLRDVPITRVNQVWSVDITYIRLKGGLVYLVAIIDWFSRYVLDFGISISMDGKGRAIDNIFVERLWRSLKYEEVYTKDYERVQEAKNGIKNYFDYYNNERLHQSLDYKTPADVYFNGLLELADHSKKGGI